MTRFEDSLQDTISDNLLADAYIEEQDKLEKAGLIPSTKIVGEKIVVLILSCLGAASIGSFVGIMIMLSVFIILNMIFHFSP